MIAFVDSLGYKAHVSCGAVGVSGFESRILRLDAVGTLNPETYNPEPNGDLNA